MGFVADLFGIGDVAAGRFEPIRRRAERIIARLERSPFASASWDEGRLVGPHVHHECWKKRMTKPDSGKMIEDIEKWSCWDAASKKDLGDELREYFIPDFSEWKDHDRFEEGFGRLLRDLKAADMPDGAP